MSKMTTLNIVTLIENNPIMRLSTTYQNKLLNKIKSNFSTEDQQLFVASFYSYLNYNTKNDFIIDLDNVWKWLGFNQKVNAKRVLERHFIINCDYKKNINNEIAQEDDKKHGGCNKETFMLTVKTFKLLCLKSDTKKANQIHEYYIKLEETLHDLVDEESNELKTQLDQLKNEFVQVETNVKRECAKKMKQEYDQKLIKEKALERQSILLREFGNAGALVYIIKVKTYETGEYVIKIGESRRGIVGRYNEHKSNYEEALLLDCFMVKQSREFEKFIHHHPDISVNRVYGLPGHETEYELFLVGKNLSYGILLNIIKTNINKYNDINQDIIKQDTENILTILENVVKCKSFQDGDVFQLLLENQNKMLSMLSNIEKYNQQILIRLENLENIEPSQNQSQTRTTTNFGEPLPTIGPRLQKINPDTLQIVKIYETVTECMREDINVKRPSINKAVVENVVYMGYRWAFVDRELDPNQLYSLQPTKPTIERNLGYMAKLNSDKTQIVNVYLDRKTAALNNGYAASGLDLPVKNSTVTKGHFYMPYDQCNDALKTEFISRNCGEPILYKSGVGQFDQQNQMIKEFLCKYDCIRTLSMSDKTLAKALDKQVAYNGHFFRSLGAKLQCFAH